MVSASSFWTRCLAEIGIGWFGIFVVLYGELWGLGFLVLTLLAYWQSIGSQSSFKNNNAATGDILLSGIGVGAHTYWIRLVSDAD